MSLFEILVKLLAIAFLSTLCAANALAGESSALSRYDDLWRKVVLYDNPEGGLLQRLALSGRAQGDYAWFDADEGDYDDLRWRRFRFGIDSRFARDWTLRLEGDFDLNNAPGDLYNRLTDAHLDWQPNPSTSLKVLKHSAGFTLDGFTSSKKLLTPERNNLTNNLWFTAEYFTGISLSGDKGKRWNYRAGLFASDGDKEIGVTGASYFTLLSLGRDFTGDTGADRAILQIDYVYNDKDPHADTRDFSQVVSLTGKWERGKWGVWGDLAYGDGYYDQEDVRGLVLMPFYSFTPRWQLVLRATRLDSDGDNGLRLNRYESSVVSGRGDEYREAFAGVNLFLYGHKLKWQNGLRYTSMEDAAGDGGEYRGWGLISGLRLSW